jgi:hypothetical protein
MFFKMRSKHAALIKTAFFVLLIRFAGTLIVTSDMAVPRMRMPSLSPLTFPLVERLEVTGKSIFSRAHWSKPGTLEEDNGPRPLLRSRCLFQWTITVLATVSCCQSRWLSYRAGRPRIELPGIGPSMRDDDRHRICDPERLARH